MTEITLEVVRAALEQADLYLNSYDTSAPSRMKASTRLAIEEAIAFLKAEGLI